MPSPCAATAQCGCPCAPPPVACCVTCTHRYRRTLIHARTLMHTCARAHARQCVCTHWHSRARACMRAHAHTRTTPARTRKHRARARTHDAGTWTWACTCMCMCAHSCAMHSNRACTIVHTRTSCMWTCTKVHRHAYTHAYTHAHMWRHTHACTHTTKLHDRALMCACSLTRMRAT